MPYRSIPAPPAEAGISLTAASLAAPFHAVASAPKYACGLRTAGDVRRALPRSRCSWEGRRCPLHRAVPLLCALPTRNHQFLVRPLTARPPVPTRDVVVLL